VGADTAEDDAEEEEWTESPSLSPALLPSSASNGCAAAEVGKRFVEDAEKAAGEAAQHCGENRAGEHSADEPAWAAGEPKG
jgi:hypothetical protein